MNSYLLTAATAEERKKIALQHFSFVQIIFDNDLVNVDDSRAAREYIMLSPQIGEVVYYVGGTRWGEEAQQVFLKLCEELPNKVSIIIGCSHEGDLLPTLRSRLTVIANSQQESSVIKFTDLVKNLESIDSYDTTTIINSVRIELQKNPNKQKADHLQRILVLFESKKLTEKQLKEALVLGI